MEKISYSLVPSCFGFHPKFPTELNPHLEVGMVLKV